MDLGFENLITRRDFLKKCGVIALTSSVLPYLTRSGYAQDARLGYVNPRPALYYVKLKGNKIQCQLCPHQCIVPTGKRGFCRVRENKNGEYHTYAYNNPCALHIDPIEKKPLYHFLPGTGALSLAIAGCNFTCLNCQNWEISQSKPEDTFNYDLSPEKIVELAVNYKTPTIAYTYTEPSVFFEYMLDTARLAKKKNVLNIYHSNGYLNEKPLLDLIPYLDGANVDLKGYSNGFYKEITGGELEPVLNTLKILKQNGVWLEITNLIIPTKNDDITLIKGLCGWIKNELGPETPLHISRFYPQHKLGNLPPTPLETLKKAADIARGAGLLYVYIGNVADVDELHTYCPACKKMLIKRQGYMIENIALKDGRCKYCLKTIAGHWQ